MKRHLRLIIDTILISLSICFIIPIVLKDIEIESIIARIATVCALIANTHLLSEHKIFKNSLFVISLVLIVIDTLIYIYL